MSSKEDDIVRMCREVIALTDMSADLGKQAHELEERASDAYKTRSDTLDALALLLGEKFEMRAFQTTDPTDGRKIIITVEKPRADTGVYVRPMELLK